MDAATFTFSRLCDLIRVGGELQVAMRFPMKSPIASPGFEARLNALVAEGLSKSWGVECPKVGKDGTLFYESNQSAKSVTAKRPLKK